MLPQLVTTTFPSQIFWVVLGFFFVYVFMALFAVPKLRKVLDSRKNHVDMLINSANGFKTKSERIQREAEELLSKIRKDVNEAEVSLIERLNEENEEQKRKISKELSQETEKKMISLKISSEETFKEISANLDEILEMASQKIGNRKS